MVKTQNFYTEQDAQNKIAELKADGKRYLIEDIIDYKSTPRAYVQISWIV